MFSVTIQLPPLVHLNGSLWRRVLTRFQREAGELVVDAVKAHLGTDDLYTLQSDYASQKPRRREYRHVAGKPPDQPLILSGSLFEGVEAAVNGDLLEIGVDGGHGISDKGFDYAERWEKETAFLEKGLRDVETDLPDLLERIIVEEMLLDL